jgi:putative transposase
MLTSVSADSSQKNRVHTIKSIRFRYTASEELLSLFENFRSMCNDAIRIALERKPTNRFNLIELAYARLKEYGLHAHYIHSACEIAYSVCRNMKRDSVPYIKSAFLKLDNESYALNQLLLRIPAAPRHFIFLKLEGSDYHLSFIDDSSLKRGSVTITARTVDIAFSKDVPTIEPVGYIGIDVNEKNVTISTTGGFEQKFAEFEEIVEIKERYREIRTSLGKVAGQDNRIGMKLLAKYGRREKNRTSQVIHKVTKPIVSYAAAHKFGIKMERLTGIRKLYRKGNRQGTPFRGRMNTWVFGETQRQIDYKAKWNGVPDWYVNPRGTSSYCLCGSRVVSLANRRLHCPACDRTWDRDDLASKNIMACAVPQERPPRRSDEKERDDDGSNPSSRWAEVGFAG